ncbi:MAG: DUF4185 domain-containing protein [Rhodomicrobium sp.]
MRKLHWFAMLTVAFAATAGILPNSSHAQTIALAGASTKVCQLIGDTDWATGQPTNAKTLTNWGLQGVDLGFPVETTYTVTLESTGQGPIVRPIPRTISPLYFLFGDGALPGPPLYPGHPAQSMAPFPPDDVLGNTSQTAVPNQTSCLNLQLVSQSISPNNFQSPAVQPPIQQGSFNVPSGGAFVGGTFYAFFWTDHCSLPTPLAPNPASPLALPPPSVTCEEMLQSSSVGRSVLAQAAMANPTSFTWTPPSGADPALARNMPSGFVYVSAAADAMTQPVTINISSSKVQGYPVFGVPRFRASIPYLAIAPQTSFGDPTTWYFFNGTDNSGNPVWVTRSVWEGNPASPTAWVPPSASAEIYSAALPTTERCVGEHSVTYNQALGVWLLLYGCGAWTIEARAAPNPWGPWSQPIVLLSAVQDPANIVCTLIQNDTTKGCPGLAPGLLIATVPNPGHFYAPFVLNRYTQNLSSLPAHPKSATIYWLVSTWNPYTVVVMQSTLQR